MVETEPTADKPSGVGDAPPTGLTWRDARQRLADNETYLLATVGPDGRPHVVPVLGVWLGDALCFNTGRTTRKARDLGRNDRCVLTAPADDVDVVLHGTARTVHDPAMLQQVADAFPRKYEWWHPVVHEGRFHDPADEAFADPRLVVAVTPTTVLAFGKEKGFSATRWRF
jgi:nitroimidazol reductase NimA-like FMN-containing flavoprotein (pyridoxamine 5'-phosphate oxidase superfamily)